LFRFPGAAKFIQERARSQAPTIQEFLENTTCVPKTDGGLNSTV